MSVHVCVARRRGEAEGNVMGVMFCSAFRAHQKEKQRQLVTLLFTRPRARALRGLRSSLLLFIGAFAE